MARYTTELSSVLQSKIGLMGSVGYSQIKAVIEQARPIIFDFDYPIYDTNYKSVLETKILYHFYDYEICAETYGLWKLYLDRKMNEIMPYYNQLYKSALLDFNPLYDVELKRTHNRKEDEVANLTGSAKYNLKSSRNIDTLFNETNTETNNTTSQNNTLDAYSDTPQGKITGVSQLDYLTNVRNIADNGTNETKTDNNRDGNNKTEDDVITNSDTDTLNKNITNSLEEYTEIVSGKQGSSSYSDMLINFRETFLNIDMLVINELAELFMLIY